MLMDSGRLPCPVRATDCGRRTPGRISMLFFVLGTFAGMFLLASQGLAEAHSSRSKHYPHRSRFSGQRAARAPEPTEPSPFFDNGTSVNVTTSAGKAVFLPCKVRHLGDRTVSWIRRRDLHVLTVGRFTYTSDQRFQTIHMENSDSWMLQIQYPQKKDAGVYECQVSTLPKISRFVTLNIIVSKASIPGGPTLYLNSGSTLNLTCNVLESPVPPDYVFWFHNGRVINYDVSREISVHTERIPKMTSRLLISNAQPQDSGNYSCVPSNADQADITVHVLNGERPGPSVHFLGPRGSTSKVDGNVGIDGLSGVVSQDDALLSTRKEVYDFAENQSTNTSVLDVADYSTPSSADSASESDNFAARLNDDSIGNRESSTGTISGTGASNFSNGNADVVPKLPRGAENNEYDLAGTYDGNRRANDTSEMSLEGNETETVYETENVTDINDFTELTAQQSRDSYDEVGSSNASSIKENIFHFRKGFDSVKLPNGTSTLSGNSTTESLDDLIGAGNGTTLSSSSNHTGDSEISDLGASNDTAKAWIANLLKDKGFNLSMVESLTNGSYSAAGNEWNLENGLTEVVSGRKSFSKLCSNVSSAEVDGLCSHVATLTDIVSTLSGALRDVLLVLKACMTE